MRGLKLVVLFTVLFTMLVAVPQPANAQSNWKLICSGAEGVVYRETGPTTTSLPKKSGCTSNDMAGKTWILVAPWGGDVAPEDTSYLACFGTWEEVVLTNKALGTINGSVWLTPKKRASLPIAAACSDVETIDDLGLNPGQNLIDIRRLPDFITKLTTMLKGQKASEFVKANSKLPISEIIEVLLEVKVAGLD